MSFHWFRTVFWLIPTIAIYTIVLGFASVTSSLFDRKGHFAHQCARAWSWLILATTGVDVDVSTVEHSRANYQAPNLSYRVASATDLSAFRDGSFDAVVAFEMIEHVAEHEQVLAEIARVLAPGGILVMSTPERRA